MYNPFLYRAPDGKWHCTWSLNHEDGAVAHTVSSNLVYWKPQSYPVLMPLGNCLDTEINYDPHKKGFHILWQSDKPTEGIYQTFTNDFSQFTPAEKSKLHPNNRREVTVGGVEVSGTVHRMHGKR